MYHNFTFVENGVTYPFQWNPTAINLGVKERTVFTPLDGPPIIHYQDTTEILGQLIWENVPVAWRNPYRRVENLVGRTGTIYTNKMPQLVGAKNLLEYSTLGDVLSGTGFYREGCNATYHEDSSVYGPDGISLVTLYKSDVASTFAGCYNTTLLTPTWAEHNVFSCYAKYGNRNQIGLNLYHTNESQSHTTYFTFSGSGEILTPGTSTTVQSSGVEKIRNSDSWFRLWIYVNGKNSSPDGDIRGGGMQLYIYPNYGWSAPEVTGTYMTDFQLEQGVETPTWFADTNGSIINEPFNVEFLDMQTEYVDLPGVVKHNIILNFKLMSEGL